MSQLVHALETPPAGVRRRRPIARVITIGTMSGLLSISSAAAAPPAGTDRTCPDKYQSMTREQIHAQADTYGISRGQADSSFDWVNMNGDLWICQKGTPFQPGFNWTDNQALGRDR